MSDLNEKQKRFVAEYLIDLNATQAAIRAGYSETSAYSQGHDLLKHPEVSECLAKAMDRRAQRTQITADKVLQELALIAFADIGDAIDVDDNGHVVIKNLKELPPESRRAIGKISQKTTMSLGNGKDQEPVEKVQQGIEYHSKVAALKMLVDHLGLSAPQKHEHSGPGGGAIKLQAHELSPAEAMERMRELAEAGDERAIALLEAARTTG